MKTILITGGSDGLGRAVATCLVGTNKVVILANNKEKTIKTAKEISCDFVVADVSDYSAVESAVADIVKKHGKIDCVVNCAGIWIEGPIESNSPENIKKVIDVNTVGTIFVNRAVVPFMKKEKSGKIINVSSQAGLYAKADRSVYNASKWAVTGFTKALSAELAPFGIGVTGFYPGQMRTNFFEKAGDSKDATQYMDVTEVAKTIKFIVDMPDNLCVPELGIKPTVL